MSKTLTQTKCLFVQNVDVQNVDVQNVDVLNVDVQNVNVQNVDVQNDDVQNVNVQNVNVQNVDVQNVDVQNVDIEKTLILIKNRCQFGLPRRALRLYVVMFLHLETNTIRHEWEQNVLTCRQRSTIDYDT